MYWPHLSIRIINDVSAPPTNYYRGLSSTVKITLSESVTLN